MKNDLPSSLRQRPSTFGQLSRHQRASGTESTGPGPRARAKAQSTDASTTTPAPVVRLVYPEAAVKSWDVAPGADAATPAPVAVPEPEARAPVTVTTAAAPVEPLEPPPPAAAPPAPPEQPRESSVPYINAGTRGIRSLGTLRSDAEIDEAVRRLTRSPDRLREQSAQGLAEEFDRFLAEQHAPPAETPAPEPPPAAPAVSEPLTFKDLEHASITGIGRLAMEHPAALSDDAGTTATVTPTPTATPTATPVAGIAILPGSTSVVDFDALLAGRASVSLQVQVDPSLAQTTAAQVLEVYDGSDAQLGEVAAPLASAVTWNGSTGAGTITAPGVYKLRVAIRTNGTVVARSDPFAVKAVRLQVGVSSPSATVSGTQTVHVIDSAGPTMPALTVTANVVGLSADEDAALARDFRLEVVYALGNRNDRTDVPGPDPTTWTTVAGPHWQPVWNGFCGEDLTVYCRVTIDGTTLEAQTPAAGHKIWGQGPAKATVRAAYDDVSQQVVGHRESRFTQFSDTTATSSLNQERPGPFTVLRSFDNGFGIGQLTNSPVPSVEQLWNWQANVADSARRLRDARQVAINHQVNVQTKHPQAPALTDDQLDLEMWCRYNSGSAYHDYDAATNSWARGAASAGRTYADALMQVRNDVQNGSPPAGWGTP